MEQEWMEHSTHPQAFEQRWMEQEWMEQQQQPKWMEQRRLAYVLTNLGLEG
jgi:hypothetical protein